MAGGGGRAMEGRCSDDDPGDVENRLPDLERSTGDAWGTPDVRGGATGLRRGGGTGESLARGGGSLGIEGDAVGGGEGWGGEARGGRRGDVGGDTTPERESAGDADGDTGRGDDERGPPGSVRAARGCGRGTTTGDEAERTTTGGEGCCCCCADVESDDCCGNAGTDDGGSIVIGPLLSTGSEISPRGAELTCVTASSSPSLTSNMSSEAVDADIMVAPPSPSSPAIMSSASMVAL